MKNSQGVNNNRALFIKEKSCFMNENEMNEMLVKYSQYFNSEIQRSVRKIKLR